MQNHLWTVFVAVVTTAVGWGARRAATALWSKVYDTDAPPNPDDTDVTWTAALSWAGLAGLSAGVARVLGRKGAAAAWQSLTKEQPPGLTATAA